MDRSDWNNAVNIHIGDNAYDAISNSNQFTNSEQINLKEKADKIKAYCESKNEELGLDENSENAYRYAFVVEPGKRPYFMELPSFGSYTYDMLDRINTDNGSNTANIADISESTDNTLVASNIDNVVTHHIAVHCPDCGSSNVKKNGKFNGNQKYQCKDCKKSWTANT